MNGTHFAMHQFVSSDERRDKADATRSLYRRFAEFLRSTTFGPGEWMPLDETTAVESHRIQFEGIPARVSWVYDCMKAGWVVAIDAFHAKPNAERREQVLITS